MASSGTDDVVPIRASLLHLHEVLLEAQRRQVERLGGRMTSGEFLQAAINDPRFKWLKELSGIITELDSATSSRDSHQVTVALARARALLDPPAPDSTFGGEYLQALQDHPEVVFAHRDAISALLGRR